MTRMPRHWFLLVISDMDALGWILSQQCMAFAPSRYRLINLLTAGDRLALYTTRGCFHSPNRDRGRVIGTATVSSPLEPLDPPVTFRDREFNRGCSLRLDRLVPVGQGPELAALAASLHTFPGVWAPHIRRTLVPLDHQDYETVEHALEPVISPTETALATYLEMIDKRRHRRAQYAG